MLRLYIGNKNYSSWSFRPWIALTGCGIPFEERLIPLFFQSREKRGANATKGSFFGI